jgi:hypothetical protein
LVENEGVVAMVSYWTAVHMLLSLEAEAVWTFFYPAFITRQQRFPQHGY